MKDPFVINCAHSIPFNGLHLREQGIHIEGICKSSSMQVQVIDSDNACVLKDELA